jgi:hypothetical protein
LDRGEHWSVPADESIEAFVTPGCDGKPFNC